MYLFIFLSGFILVVGLFPLILVHLKVPEYFQASVYSLLQAASEISSRGDHRDRDINVFVLRRY